MVGAAHSGMVRCGQWANVGAQRNIRFVGSQISARILVRECRLPTHWVVTLAVLMCAFSSLIRSSNILSLTLLTLVGAVSGDVTRLVAEITNFVVICRCHHCRLHCLYRVFADSVIRGQMVLDVIHEPCDAISECWLRLT